MAQREPAVFTEEFQLMYIYFYIFFFWHLSDWLGDFEPSFNCFLICREGGLLRIFKITLICRRKLLALVRAGWSKSKHDITRVHHPACGLVVVMRNAQGGLELQAGDVQVPQRGQSSCSHLQPRRAYRIQPLTCNTAQQANIALIFGKHLWYLDGRHHVEEKVISRNREV